MNPMIFLFARPRGSYAIEQLIAYAYNQGDTYYLHIIIINASSRWSPSPDVRAPWHNPPPAYVPVT